MASGSVRCKHRLVHLDLKGAPPKIEYLEKIIPLMKKWGATGLLVEYEDTFPFSGDLNTIRSKEFYSVQEIDAIQGLAAENNMIVIPLLQTFGHMEFVLKHAEFQNLREVKEFPMALCPSNPDSLRLVCSMIDQVMVAHSNLQWFHIGCDEVFHLGKCEMCQQQLKELNMTSHELFINHVKNVAKHVKDKYPAVTPIVWDDMFRNTELEVLKDSGLGEMVEPMVWVYLSHFVLPEGFWKKLSEVFPNLWVATAFKGATGPRSCLSSISYHLDNHLTWINILEEEEHRFVSVQGCAITGWQRYDHYAVLCELLPQALPSLAICLQTLERGQFSEALHQSVSEDLGFTPQLPLNPFSCREIPQCLFPGSAVYLLMLEYASLEVTCERFLSSETCLTWLNEYNVKRNFINPVHVASILNALSDKRQDLDKFRVKVAAALSEVFYPGTVQEWLGTHVQPLYDKTFRMEQTARDQLSVLGLDSSVVNSV